MIFIDLKNKKPTDADLPAAVRWTEDKWAEWKAESDRLVSELARLTSEGKLVERNELIDANGDHWKALKPWLLALSDGKCWFSESKDLYSHYDVEHFRPKKEAKSIDGTVRDGYWWLAFNYMNFRACGNVGNRKKGGWFPLQQGSLCSAYELQREESEAIYLLDPTDSVDVSLLSFDEEGKAVPIENATDWEKERVLETVKRLKLNEHVPLAEERRKIWQKVDGLINEFNEARARCRAGNNPVAKERMAQACRQIREFTSKKAELSSVAAWCLLLRNDPQLTRLIS